MQAIQTSFADLGTPLFSVDFVVVDLETTGGSPESCGITEIGAVKVRAGEVLGEFQTLVNPGAPIPAVISVLTGITNSMVAGAPRIEQVMPAFLEFARGSVLVAHNAGFDMSFLKVACARLGRDWPGYQVLDTVTLARHLVTNDETPNRKLGSLARLFGATTTPDHRALHDARATVDVLHALMGRVGSLGVTTLEELLSYSSRVPPAVRRKRVLADRLPHQPGVYVFKDGEGKALYVGTSKDIRSRVRSYFTASEHRSRMAHMVTLAESVTPIVCQTPLEAAVRELRLIASAQPRFNRRSKRPDRVWWLKLTNEAFPRLSLVRSLGSQDEVYAGPYRSKEAAESAATVVYEAVPLRQCTQKLSRTPSKSACALAEMGKCGAPCTGAQTLDAYAEVAADAAHLVRGDARQALERIESRLQELAEQERFEDATLLRDRMLQLVRGVSRAQRIQQLRDLPNLVAARRLEAGGWEVICVRQGRLAGTVVTARGANPMPAIEAMTATAEVSVAAQPDAQAWVEEAELILKWLDRPGVRLVDMTGSWSCPVGSAQRRRHLLEDAAADGAGLRSFDDGDRRWTPRAG